MPRRLSRNVLVGGLALAVLLTVSATPILARSGDGAPGAPGASCDPGDASCAVWVDLSRRGPIGGTPTRGSVVCEYTPGPPWLVPDANARVVQIGTHLAPPPEGMRWMLSRCENLATGEVRAGIVLVRLGGSGGPAGLAREAAGRLEVPAPVPATSPPLGSDVAVGVPVWLWLTSAPGELSVTAAVPGLSATVTATPTEVVWDMGDGIRVVCRGPGVAWVPGMPDDATNCGHTYRFTAIGLPGQVFTGSVTTRWRTHWSASDGSSGTLAMLTRSSPFTVRVVEVQAVNGA